MGQWNRVSTQYTLSASHDVFGEGIDSKCQKWLGKEVQAVPRSRLLQFTIKPVLPQSELNSDAAFQEFISGEKKWRHGTGGTQPVCSALFTNLTVALYDGWSSVPCVRAEPVSAGSQWFTSSSLSFHSQQQTLFPFHFLYFSLKQRYPLSACSSACFPSAVFRVMTEHHQSAHSTLA